MTTQRRPMFLSRTLVAAVVGATLLALALADGHDHHPIKAGCPSPRPPSKCHCPICISSFSVNTITLFVGAQALPLPLAIAELTLPCPDLFPLGLPLGSGYNSFRVGETGILLLQMDLQVFNAGLGVGELDFYITLNGNSLAGGAIGRLTVPASSYAIASFNKEILAHIGDQVQIYVSSALINSTLIIGGAYSAVTAQLFHH